MREWWNEDWYLEWLAWAHRNQDNRNVPPFNYDEVEKRLQSEYFQEQQKKLDK